MAAEECIKEIREAAGVEFTDEELDDMLTFLDRVKQSRKAKGGLETLEEELLDAADNLAKDAVEAAQIERRNRLINIRVFHELVTRAEDADKAFNNPALGLEAATVGVHQNLKDGRFSVDSTGHALATKYQGSLAYDLRKENLFAEFNSKEFELEIARDLVALTDPNAIPSGNPKTRKIAEIIDKHRKVAIARANRAGSWIKPLPGYITRQTHDMHKIRRAGPEQWREKIFPLLDIEKTFKGANQEEFLKEAYRGLSTGLHLKNDGEVDLKLAFKGPGNLAKRLSQKRVFHFKDADSFMAYNREFGSTDLRSGIFQELERMARSTALMETFGPNPRAMFDRVLDELKTKYRDDPKKFDQLRAEKLGAFFNQIDGTAMIPINPTGAMWSSIVRSIISMSKLGGSVISAFADTGFMSAEFHRQGIPWMKTWGRSLTRVIEGLPQSEQREIADLIGVGLDGMIGDMYARFSAPDNLPGVFNKAMRLYFKVNLLGPWTDANKRGMSLIMARDMAMNSEKQFSELNENISRMLQRYGIGENEWNIIKRATKNFGDDDRAFLMPDEIQNLPDNLFSGSRRAIQKQKDQLETALRSFYVDRADFGSPTPGARERASFLLGGTTRSGTRAGEAMRFIGQFKAFPLTALSKGLGETLMLSGSPTAMQGLKSALLNGKGEMAMLANLIIGTTIMGYVAQSAKEMAKGRTPRDPEDPGTWVAAALQGGGLGIYGDFLFGEANRFGGSLVDTLAGPAIGTLSDVQGIWAQGLAGEPIAGDTLRLIYSNTPFLNLFYTRTALDYLILYQMQESINPGYLRRMERRIERENNQRFLIPPSGVIPRGGGTKAFEAVR